MSTGNLQALSAQWAWVSGVGALLGLLAGPLLTSNIANIALQMLRIATPMRIYLVVVAFFIGMITGGIIFALTQYWVIKAAGYSYAAWIWPAIAGWCLSGALVVIIAVYCISIRVLTSTIPELVYTYALIWVSSPFLGAFVGIGQVLALRLPRALTVRWLVVTSLVWPPGLLWGCRLLQRWHI